MKSEQYNQNIIYYFKCSYLANICFPKIMTHRMLAENDLHRGNDSNQEIHGVQVMLLQYGILAYYYLKLKEFEESGRSKVHSYLTPLTFHPSS